MNSTRIGNAATNMVSNIATNIKTNISNIANTSFNSSSSTNSAYTGMMSVVFFYGLIIGLLVVIIYYFQTIKYYSMISYEMLKEYMNSLFGKNEVEVPEEAKKMMKPSERPGGIPGASDPSLLEKVGEQLPQRNEVFNVSKNIYTYNDASAVCRALDADLATYDQVKEAYDQGGDWCNYGWVKGQMAVYPTQQHTYDKLQKGPASMKKACGNVGINGGFFDNPELRFGVNCFGKRPSKRATDAITNDIAIPLSAEEVEFEKKVQRFREQNDDMNVLPFSRGFGEGKWGSN
jgi:hypothetical protein